MENKVEMLELLKQIAENKVSPEEALKEMQMEPFEELGYAKVDHHRTIRQGHCEVIYGASKNPDQIIGILKAMYAGGAYNILVTRIDEEKAEAIKEAGIEFDYRVIAELGIAYPKEHELKGNVVVASAGTSDIKVCEEAAVTAEVMGSKVTRIYDIGVSGIHRLFAHTEELLSARCVVVVAGMEGALASVVGGMVSCPVIAVPTSVGYGANFGGLSALLSMLNSCASGCSVVNIDNGFGAGYQANLINMMEGISD